ncbi:MAG: hypothetical protein C6W56_01835 [Caldibacillus debilis]|nr:hypothetical protein [Bacillaceae bacterium]REJ30710.1 MAG: hypothetical protein C6W56_01835 [Caldibacillus debilis]
MIKRTGWKAAVPAEGLVTVPFLFRVGEYWRRRETAPSRRKIAASSTGLRLVPFHFGRMRRKGASVPEGVFTLCGWNFRSGGRCPKYLLAVRFLKA